MTRVSEKTGAIESPWQLLIWILHLPLVPLFLCLVLVGAIISIPLSFVYGMKERRDARIVRDHLKCAGRWIDWTDVETNLRRGIGTLIFEDLGPNSLGRVWWTKDDLMSDAPADTPVSWDLPPRDPTAEPPPQQKEYADAMIARYLHLENGTAWLTKIPRGHCDYSSKFPMAKIITLVPWANQMFTSQA
jgi:hypothetical protein